MRKNIVVTFLFTILFVSCLKSQSFSHSFGIGFLAGYEGLGLGSVYSPRINMVKIGEGVTASVGTHFALALNTSSDGASTIQSFVGIEMPLVFELNFGAKSHPDNYNSFGGFIGVGYGFSSISSDRFAKGVVYNAGFRFAYDWGVRFAYMDNSDPFREFGAASIIFQVSIR